MGIFYKRPLCLFCFCFIGTSLLAVTLGIFGKIAILASSILATALLFFLSWRIEKRKYGLIEAAICAIFISISLASSLLAIDLPLKRLEKYTAENAPIEFVVLETEYNSKYSTRYEGILLSTDKGKIGQRAYLNFSHEADYVAGDRLLLLGKIEIAESNSETILPSDVNLEITSTLDKDLVILKKFDGFSLSVASAKLRHRIRNIFCELLEPDSAALSLGFLTSNTSMLSGRVVRDFRRSGVSHLLAVSGLHLSLLVGAFDFLLTRLKIRKSIRCIATTALSLLLLTVSGFSLSASRSVLMLLVAYLCYYLSRESDTLTSLSVAGMLILLVSPVSVGSLSFWLSFLATLGIVLYSELLSKLRKRKPESKKGFVKIFLRSIRKIAGALTVTLSANVFICIIFYLAFGETSVISPIANLTVTPLGEVYLAISVLTLLFGKVSFVGSLLCHATEFLASLITSLAAYLSSFEFSAVSLRHVFAGVIITAMTFSLAVLFTVKLKEKRWLFAPPVLALASFCVCLLIYNATNTQIRAVYTSDGGRDSVAVADGGELLIIDVSDGTYSSLYNAYEWAREQSFVEADMLVLTHYHPKHISSLDKFFGNVVVHDLYLPEPKTSNDILILEDITKLAIENGVSPTLYKSEELTRVGSSILYVPREDSATVSSRRIISFLLRTKEGAIFYADSLSLLGKNAELQEVFINSCDTLILGSHSPLPEGKELPAPSSSQRVIIADAEKFSFEFSFENNP